jgi:hypothetical protein
MTHEYFPEYPPFKLATHEEITKSYITERIKTLKEENGVDAVPECLLRRIQASAAEIANNYQETWDKEHRLWEIDRENWKCYFREVAIDLVNGFQPEELEKWMESVDDPYRAIMIVASEREAKRRIEQEKEARGIMDLIGREVFVLDQSQPEKCCQWLSYLGSLTPSGVFGVVTNEDVFNYYNLWSKWKTENGIELAVKK